MRLVVLGPLSVVLVALVGCPSAKKEEPTDAGTPTIALAADGGPDAGASGGDDIEPIYPVEQNAPVVALAEKLCGGLSTSPEAKRSACCHTTPAVVVTNECTRALGAALRHNAVALDAADVDRCLAAFDRTLEGCEWVGPFPPGPPKECQGILKGKLATGAKCRSSLECTGDQHCIGLGPTTVGKCGPPGADGESCGGAVDSLAVFTRQNDVDKRHPECRDRCLKHRCAAPVGENAACQISADCADGLQCLAASSAAKAGMSLRRCVAGKAPSKDGEPCPGGTCEGDLQCIRNICTARKPTGAACTDDFECRGGCLRDGGGPGTKGTCGQRCDIR